MNEELTTDQQQVRAQDAELFYRNHFKKYLEDRELGLLREMGTKDWTKDTKEQALLYQGALAFLKEIDEWFKEQTSLSLSRFNKDEEEPESSTGIPPMEI